VVAGQRFTESIIVDVDDAQGNVATSDDSDVTLSILNGPNGGTLIGTVTVAATNGEATFSNLELTGGGDYTLEATDGALTPANSANINAIVGCVDQANLDYISGWAYNPNDPTQSVAIK